MRLTLITLSTIISVGSAFKNIPNHFNGTTYYGVTDGMGGFTWTTIQPGPPAVCVARPTPYCTIITIGGYHPVTNVVPTSSQATAIVPGLYTYL